MAKVTARNFNSRSRKFGKPKQLANARSRLTVNEDGSITITIDDIAMIEVTFDRSEFMETISKLGA